MYIIIYMYIIVNAVCISLQTHVYGDERSGEE